MYLPLMFKSTGMRVLLIGGGDVASHKLGLLSAAGCVMTVITPRISENIKKAVTDGQAVWIEREFRDGDCIGYQLIIAATENRTVNQQIYGEAVSLGIPINVVDDPERCTVIFPAIWRQGALNVSVSTEGGAPFMASAVRDRLAAYASPLARWVDIAAEFRTVVRSEISDRDLKNRMYQKLVAVVDTQDPPDPPESKKLDDWIEWLVKIVEEKH
jgi:uroporphyrin-III C-methyltransferase / precorrin-2 dehydrogenase / sirohydrochlorin ferrochelatase